MPPPASAAAGEAMAPGPWEHVHQRRAMDDVADAGHGPGDLRRLAHIAEHELHPLEPLPLRSARRPANQSPQRPHQVAAQETAGARHQYRPGANECVRHRLQIR